MRHGEIWTAAGESGYGGQPRPVVVIQDDRFDVTDSVTICAFTIDPTDAPLFRLRVEPSKASGFHDESSIMVDKITTAHRSRLTKRVGQLGDDDLIRLGRAVLSSSGSQGLEHAP